MHIMVFDLITEGKIPQEMNEVIIVPIHKKGNEKEWKNWRPIALTNTLFRIIDKVITSRIKDFI